jgi:hypothetical protein
LSEWMARTNRLPEKGWGLETAAGRDHIGFCLFGTELRRPPSYPTRRDPRARSGHGLHSLPGTSSSPQGEATSPPSAHRVATSRQLTIAAETPKGGARSHGRREVGREGDGTPTAGLSLVDWSANCPYQGSVMTTEMGVGSRGHGHRSRGCRGTESVRNGSRMSRKGRKGSRLPKVPIDTSL